MTRAEQYQGNIGNKFHADGSVRSSVSKKWQMPLFRGSKFGQPEVARICKELILRAKSLTREAGKAGLHE